MDRTSVTRPTGLTRPARQASAIDEIKKSITEAREAYQAICNTAPIDEVRAASRKVKELQAKLSWEITKGAKPCPKCGERPHGLEQPGPKNATYEVGCIGCNPFLHSDGTVREFRAIGGLLPRHTVEAWNEGPSAWSRNKGLEQKLAEDKLEGEGFTLKEFTVPDEWSDPETAIAQPEAGGEG